MQANDCVPGSVGATVCGIPRATEVVVGVPNTGYVPFVTLVTLDTVTSAPRPNGTLVCPLSVNVTPQRVSVKPVNVPAVVVIGLPPGVALNVAVVEPLVAIM